MQDRRAAPASLAAGALPGLALLFLATPARSQGYLLQSIGGLSPGDFLGFGIAGPGDLNGDGLADLLVGAPQCSFATRCLGSCGTGAAGLFSGANGSLLLFLGGTAAGQMLGWSVAGAGDVNLDGTPDFLVGTFCTLPGGPTEGGRATLHSGASGAPLYAFDGAGVGDHFGWSVAGVGDVNADGVLDVAAGAPSSNYVKVFSGATGGTLYTLNGAGSFGMVAGPGDLNGDNHAEIAVGAWLSGPGQVFVYSGATGGTIYSFIGSFPGDRFGGALAGVGDTNGDGVPDLLVGAGTASPGGMGLAGEARLFSGATGGVLHSFAGSAPLDGFGWGLAGPGDVDGDGLADVLIGAQGGTAGGGPPASGYARVFSGGSGLPIYTIAGASSGESFGRFCGGPGDVNGDGVPDLLVAAHNADPGGVADAGQARVFSVVGIPAGSSLFGAGCPGSSGAVPRISTAGGAPSAATGNLAFKIVLSRARPLAIASIVVGVSNTSWAGLSLPFPLGILGMPACSLLVAHDFAVPLSTTAEGTIFLPAAVPANPALSGGTVYFQWFVVDPGPAIFPGAMTQGLAVVL